METLDIICSSGSPKSPNPCNNQKKNHHQYHYYDGRRRSIFQRSHHYIPMARLPTRCIYGGRSSPSIWPRNIYQKKRHWNSPSYNRGNSRQGSQSFFKRPRSNYDQKPTDNEDRDSYHHWTRRSCARWSYQRQIPFTPRNNYDSKVGISGYNSAYHADFSESQRVIRTSTDIQSCGFSVSHNGIQTAFPRPSNDRISGSTSLSTENRYTWLRRDDNSDTSSSTTPSRENSVNGQNYDAENEDDEHESMEIDGINASESPDNPLQEMEEKFGDLDVFTADDVNLHCTHGLKGFCLSAPAQKGFKCLMERKSLAESTKVRVPRPTLQLLDIS